ncbi:hypothetical protein [Agarilytica rhodophyticola]|uniref:hypothetical protein n=1 Tax=Agarilytica rhodophyticola TaxID=1737490 RepID=UPI000B344785|nr:hypothetical protein [Agarilytica rhodophyticola]
MAPITLSNVFGVSYTLHILTDNASANRDPQQFNDELSALRFLNNFNREDKYWLTLVSEFTVKGYITSNQNHHIPKHILAQLMVAGKIKFYKNIHTGILSIPIEQRIVKNKKGITFILSHTDEKTLISKKKPNVLTTQKNTEEFVDEVLSDDSQVDLITNILSVDNDINNTSPNKTYTPKLKTSQVSTANNTVKQKLTEKILNKEIIILEDSEPIKPDEKPIVQDGVSNLPGVRPHELAPETQPEDPKKINITPKIDCEYLLILQDRNVKQKNASKDNKILTQATRIELSLTQDSPSPVFDKGARFEVSGAGKIELFEDEKLTKVLNIKKVIDKKHITGGKKLEVWLKGKTSGKITLKLTAEKSSNSDFIIKPPATQEMGVAELILEVYKNDISKLNKVKINPNVDPIDDYHKKLKDEKIPDQIKLSDDDKVNKGRVLHVQNNANHDRGKIVLKKLEKSHLPKGCDDYDIILSEKNTSGSTTIFDQQESGKKATFPVKVKLKDLLVDNKEFWVEGTTACQKQGDVVLDLGLDRKQGGLSKTPKRNADFAVFSPIKLEDIALDYTPTPGKAAAWDASNKRYYINLDSVPKGRKITLKAKLSTKIKDIDVHFMLAANANNKKAANWGAKGLPKTWKWDKIDSDVKHKDKNKEDDFLHLCGKTDSNGEVSQEVVLSQFGGDIFTPACYINEDPHLAKYIPGHTDLAKRKPVSAKDAINVWRKFWCQYVKVDGINMPSLAPAIQQYDNVKAFMDEAPEIKVSTQQVSKFKPQALYPEYMVRVNGGTDNVLVVSENNKKHFFKGDGPIADTPIKIPILVCDAQWDPDGKTKAKSAKDYANKFPIDIETDKLVIDPPLQGRNLLVSGKWVAAEKVSSKYVNVRRGKLGKGDITVNQKRKKLTEVTVKTPSKLKGIKPNTHIWIEDLVIQGAAGYLGESFMKRILAVYKAKGTQLEKEDFQNTIVHEIGHAFRQVVEGDPAGGIKGIPRHPNQKNANNQGNHCRYLTNKCVMYDAGPIKGSLNRYCDVCHPYLLVQDMSDIV